MSQKIVAGIDIGGTNTKYGFVSEEGKILWHGSIPTTQFPDANDFVDAMSKMLIRDRPEKTGHELCGIGIGAPNGNYYSGTIEFAPNLRWKGIVPLSKLFSEATHLPVALTNDAKAGAIGEMVFGGAKGMKDFFFITLGTGLGSGIVSNGKIVYGHDGFAGELGHTTVKQGSNRLCGCGRYGCLETYVSAPGIRKSYMKLLAEKDKRAPVEPEKIDAEFIYERAKQGDQEALKSFEYTGEILGLALTNAVALFSPEAIFLFGGLTQSGDFIFKPARESFEKNLLRVYKDKIKILPSMLPENETAILGAASLIWNELKKDSR